MNGAGEAQGRFLAMDRCQEKQKRGLSLLACCCEGIKALRVRAPLCPIIQDYYFYVSWQPKPDDVSILFLIYGGISQNAGCTHRLLALRRC